MTSSLFITLEGTDGAGKSFQIHNIKNFFESLSYQVLLTREPGGTPFFEDIRPLWLNQAFHLEPTSQILLLLSARYEHIHKVILPALKRKKTVVLCERFNDATLAYQGYGMNVDVSYIESLIHTSGCTIIRPHLTFWFDISPREALLRKQQNLPLETSQDSFETEGERLLNRVYEGYKKLYYQHKDRIVAIDATQPKEAVFQQITQSLYEVFSLC